MSLLSQERFRSLIDGAPLISIDLIVRNVCGHILLGHRLNRPAAGFWFVPGGRVLKNESISVAFERLTTNELGQAFSVTQARYIGLFEHFYDDSVFGDAPSTHYIANGFELVVDEGLMLPKEQHDEYVWMDEDELLTSDVVHLHTKWYFQQEKGFKTL